MIIKCLYVCKKVSQDEIKFLRIYTFFLLLDVVKEESAHNNNNYNNNNNNNNKKENSLPGPNQFNYNKIIYFLLLLLFIIIISISFVHLEFRIIMLSWQ